MGYERNDRRYGGDRDRDDRSRGGYRSYGPSGYDNRDQGYYGQASSEDRNRGYGDRDRGYGDRGFGGGSSYGAGDRGRSYGRNDRDDEDRGFFERAGDEVRSWFGDEDAERRRRQDDRENGGSDRDQGRYASGRSGGGFSGRDDDRARGGISRYASGQQSSGHDPHYSDWRDRQVQSLDRDYEEYRRHNQSRFENEFASWRQTRQTQRDSLKQAKEHDEVVGSDGEHLGTVDHVRGDKIKLTKNDQNAGGHHHTIPSAWISKVEDGKVTINKTAAEAKRQWTEADDDDRSRSSGLFGRNDDEEGQRNLNRSFSGTY